MPATPKLSRAWRNNNPLNIRPLASGQHWAGQSGVDHAGSAAGYVIFSHPSDGWLAGYVLLRNYWLLHGLNTVRGVCNRWAPPSDNNPTSSYIDTVSSLSGYGPDLVLDLTNATVLRCMGNAMAIMESGDLPWPDADKDAAVARLAPHAQPPPRPAPVIDNSPHADDNVSDALNQRELDRIRGFGTSA